MKPEVKRKAKIIPNSWENYLHNHLEQIKDNRRYKVRTEERYFIKALVHLQTCEYDIKPWKDKYENNLNERDYNNKRELEKFIERIELKK
jgi:hypothetical protein